MDIDRLTAIGSTYEEDSRRKDASYLRLVAAIWEASDEGMRQVDIVRAVGLTRERVRQICNPVYRRAMEVMPGGHHGGSSGA